MIRRISKFIFTFWAIVFASLFFYTTAYANVEIKAYSGLEYNESSTLYQVIHVEITNTGSKIEGTLEVNLRENDQSTYSLVYPMYIYANSTQSKDIKINLNGNQNVIVISLKDEGGNIISTRNLSLNDIQDNTKISVGLIASGPVIDQYNKSINNSPNDFCDIYLIDEEKYYENNSLFNNLDIIILSDIDAQNFSTFFDNAIYDFINGGGICYACFKDVGTSILPDSFSQYLNQVDFRSSKSLQKMTVGNGEVIVRGDSFFDNWIEGTSANAYVKNFIDLSLDLEKIAKLRERKVIITNEAVLETDELLKKDNTLGMPNIYLYLIILMSFIMLVGPVPFFLSRRFSLFRVYNQYALLVSLTFIALSIFLNMAYSSFRIIKNQSNIVHLVNNNASELSFITFRYPYIDDYTFEVENNAEIIPILSDSKKSSYVDQDSNTKETVIINNENNSIINVNNKDIYSKNSIYLLRQYDNIYQVSFDSIFYDDRFVGTISNLSNNELKNAYVMYNDKYAYIGSVPPQIELTLSNYASKSMPINDISNMSSKISGEYSELIKMYLDMNQEEYLNNIYLFYEVYDGISASIVGSDVSPSTGKTTFIQKSNYSNYVSRRDVNLLETDFNVISGYYNSYDNSILGNEEVVIEYNIESNIDYSKMYMNQIDEEELALSGKFVPFKGNIYLYNYKTSSYDLILAHAILSPSNYISKDDKVRVRYVPTSLDESYKNMYLTYFRMVGGYR